MFLIYEERIKSLLKYGNLIKLKDKSVNYRIIILSKILEGTFSTKII